MIQVFLIFSILLCLHVKILRSDDFHAFIGLKPVTAYGSDGIPLIVFRNCLHAFSLPSQLLQLCPSISTFPSYWKFAYHQPVPKKGDRSNPTSCRPIVLISCLSKVLASAFNRKILKRRITSQSFIYTKKNETK